MNVQAFCNVPLLPPSATGVSGRINYGGEAIPGRVEEIRKLIAMVVMEGIVLLGIWLLPIVLTIPALDNVDGKVFTKAPTGYK